MITYHFKHHLPGVLSTDTWRSVEDAWIPENIFLNELLCYITSAFFVTSLIAYQLFKNLSHDELGQNLLRTVKNK